MNVDLPAPLSPSTHVTWPAPTRQDTSLSAITLPKYLEMLRTSSSGGPPLVGFSLIAALLPRSCARGC